MLNQGLKNAWLGCNNDHALKWYFSGGESSTKDFDDLLNAAFEKELAKDLYYRDIEPWLRRGKRLTISQWEQFAEKAITLGHFKAATAAIKDIKHYSSAE